jgi:hypothetical protein
MSLTVQPFPGVIDELGFELPEALASLDDTRGLVEGDDEVELSVVGPFPTYAADPREFVAQGQIVAERTGWRALLQHGEIPRAVIDITFSTAGEPRFGYRGQDPAKAFADALDVAVGFAEDEQRYDVRWLSLPGIYVTALWLRGETSIFVPTRSGGIERTHPEALSNDQLREIVARLMETAVAQPEGGGEARLADGPKSGFE